MDTALDEFLSSINEKLPLYGTIKVDIYQGKISFVEVTEKHKIQIFKNNN
jgi:hypothetical protein